MFSKIDAFIWKIIWTLFPNEYEMGKQYIFENWEEINPDRFLHDLKMSEALCGGGRYEDGLRMGILIMKGKQNASANS